MNMNGKFQRVQLPVQAQYAPVFSIAVDDFNNDSNPDILLAGNLEKTRVRTGVFAGNYGFLFEGNGIGRFAYVNQLKSGLSIRGDVKHILQDGKKLIFGINNHQPVIYRRI